MNLTVQSRLTAWYAGALLTALALCGLGLYTAVVRLERGVVDADLQRAASTTAFSMEAEIAEGLTLEDAATDTVGELRIAGIAVAIYDGGGGLLAARWEGIQPVTLDRASLDRLDTIRDTAGDWRGLVTKHRYKDRDYLVLNAIPLDGVRRHAALIRTAFLIVVPLTCALAVGGGWLLARSTLRPVLESQRQFMADASHELRTPVSVIRTAADITLTRQNRSPEEYADAMTVVSTQAQRLTSLVEDLFLLARADVQARPLRVTRFYLDEVISECARAVDVLGVTKNIHFEMATVEDVEIDGDESLVRRMLMNLFENAVRHSPEGGTVRVTLVREASHVTIAVADSGPGVPVEARERIFHRFVRLERAAGGAGLGLPIARWIAEAHKGTLTIADSSSFGSVFVVRLPMSAKAGA